MFSSIAIYMIIKQSTVYTQLNNQADLFQTIKFSVNHLFVVSLNIKTILFDP